MNERYTKSLMKSFRLNINLLSAILWLLYPNPSLSACYFPDGSVAPQDTPCQVSTKQATCCGQGYACLSNSICMATGDEIKKPGATLYVRGSCTDPTWRSSACPLFCINPDPPNRDNLAGGNGIAKCPDAALDMYYCIDYNMNNVNCSAQQHALIFQGTPTALTTIGVTATTEISSSILRISSATANSSSVVTTTTSYSTTTGNPSPTASQVAAETTTPAAAEPKPAQNHTGVIAGATVGGFVGLAAIAALVYFVHRRAKRQRGQRLGLTPSSQLSSGDVYMTDMSVARQSIPSKQDARPLYEAPGTEYRTYELAG